MELFSSGWWSALLAIVLIDLVLAGDNAIVIALAARSLPSHLQRRAIVWGTVGAIVVRSAMTVFVVWLLRIPGLMLAGGLGLVWIAYKLLAPPAHDQDNPHAPRVSTFWGAMKTIVIADALMGIDNVLGVAGAAKGSFDLVVIGLLISVPIVVWGSTMVLKLVERFPVIIYAGAGVLAYTAAHMIVSEPLLDAVFDPNLAIRLATYAALVTGVLAAGWWTARRAQQRDAHGATAA
jgi:YjbE family integral membrane protein